MRASPIVVNPALLDVARRRRTAGESLRALAGEFGITWQKLDKAIRHGLRNAADSTPETAVRAAQERTEAVPNATLEATPDTRPLSLAEKYRPRTLAGLWGQPRVVTALRRFAKAPCSTAFLFEGETGTGKTSAALALARELGCDVGAGEWGGVWEIASGEQSADAVREMGRRMCLHPGSGSGWKVVIVNECDRMCRPAEVIWLDLLEHLPRQSIVVFTTNDPALLSARFRDRCTRLEFRSNAAYLAAPTRDFLLAVWRAETGQEPDLLTVERMVLDSVQGGKVSLRRAVQMLGAALLERSEGAKP
jgi:replication-associated recombination protein RarA